jgi:hypothetical protein
LSLQQNPPSLADAQQYLDELQRQKPEGLWDSLSVKIVTAQLLANSGNAVEVEPWRKALEAARDDAKKLSFVELEFQARLALAEIEIKRGNVGLAERFLGELGREASAKGFLLLARRAGELRKTMG